MHRLAPPLLTCWLAAGACGGEASGEGATATTPDPPAAPFELTLRGDTVGVHYAYDAFLGRLAQGAGDATVRIEEGDVDALLVGPAPSHTLELRLTDASGARLRSALAELEETQPFTVAVHGEQLFAGVVYSSYGAAAIRFPVLHVRADDGPVVLHVSAIQGASFLGAEPAEAARVDRAELREVFARAGKLREVEGPPVP